MNTTGTTRLPIIRSSSTVVLPANNASLFYFILFYFILFFFFYNKMAPIQLPMDSDEQQKETGCLSSIFSRFKSSNTLNKQDKFNEKYIYSAVDPIKDDLLPPYEDIIKNMKKLNVKCDNEIESIVNKEIDSISSELRDISLDIHKHAETSMKEFHAHDILTAYLEKKGFKVTRHAYGLQTAFMAEYDRGDGRRVGICSEYDALPGLGQGCGHNLIAISGLAIALGIKAALDSGKASGKVVLFGTPAEELSIGKIVLINKGAFQENVDVCLMLHPAAVDHQYANFIAIHDVKVEFFGKASHASGSPWAGINALDALVQVWNGISMMRQQLLPTDRVHGIVTNGGQAPNVIPEYTSAFFFVRTTKANQIERLMKKLEACFEAAALATGCKVKYTWREIGLTKDVIQNRPLADFYAQHMSQYGIKFPSEEDQFSAGGGSTDMGNVSYEIPCIHPTYGIHTTASNHTVEFTKAAKTMEAHQDTLVASKCMALTGIEVLLNDTFYDSIQRDFKGNQFLFKERSTACRYY
ncbi:uncharacterized protein BX663DRAFT_521192 [Cokeromyces recurvatus]|uniref:uncharacterized protein n=1 Tax=Cokeromyces recurvatus TaxID=90255 RepID=UPI00221F1A5B|nr:uncharacterized protein BX663DRAFT_521192 [Cokeromyces recurvatus]KAI7899527.1 hypothetical protein BX663DRAFT_521192 [Cokeromyces recurvatus]